MAPLITVSIVTYNSRHEIERCLKCLCAQTIQSFHIFAWDNASTDGTADLLKAVSHPQFTFLHSAKNIGFCAAHNKIIGRSSSEFILVLNPDCYLEPEYLETAVRAAQRNSLIGAVAGKLYRLRSVDEDFVLAQKAGVLDSTGIYFTPSFRHFDRGSNEIESDRWNREEWVFGVTGAAAFYRRAMLEEIQIDGEYFDEAFFAYREDADLAWRMQSAGWKCLYTPHAVGYHVRKIFPRGRAQAAALINMHSLKNRFLFRLNNVSWKTAVRFLVPMLARDLAALGYTFVFERSSLPAFTFILKNFRTRWNKRKLIRQKQKVPLSYLHQWIRWRPTAFGK